MVPINSGDVGEVSKAGVALLDRVSEALGWILKPVQIKRIAKAETEASMIRAEGEIQITELQRRAFTRLLAEESRAQENIEAIAFQAVPLLAANAPFQEMNDDWITNFFDKCRIISDEQMQQLWSKVLAGEANQPGSFSKRTVNLLGSMDKNDASQFSRLCSFNVMIQEEWNPLIYSLSEPFYKEHNITDEVLRHLDSIGLIAFMDAGYIYRTDCPKIMDIRYHERRLKLEFLHDINTMPMGRVEWTQAGRELAILCEAEEITELVEWMLELFNSSRSPIRIKNGIVAVSLTLVS